MLIEVITIDLKYLSKPFLDYDTDDGLYKLPKSGLYMMLLFEGSRGLFTTMRAAWPEKKIDYYRSRIGQEFTIEVL